MKKRIWKALSAVAVAATFVVSLCACTPDSIIENGKTPTVYEIAKDIGYDGTESEWIAALNGAGGSELRAAYSKAVKEGSFDGSYAEFLAQYSLADETAAVNRALMSVVSINSEFTLRSFYGTTSTVRSMGSGVFYQLDRENGNALVITNYHVIYHNSSIGNETVPHVSDAISVYLYGGEYENGAISAKFIGGSKDNDIAVLKIEGSNIIKNSYARAVDIANSDAVTVGDRVYAIGNPEGEGISVSSGIVSVDAEYINIEKLDDESQTVSMLEIRTDAAVNHGNSGGGLFDVNGRLLGIVNAKTEEEGVDGMGYAIPSKLAISVAQNVIDTANNESTSSLKCAFCATLGIEVSTAYTRSVYNEETGKVYIEETLKVESVTSGGAMYSKLRAGDILYSVELLNAKGEVVIAETNITRLHHLTVVLFNVRNGYTVNLTVQRGVDRTTYSATYDNLNMFKQCS